MRFVLDGKTYDCDSVLGLSLRDCLAFDREAQAGGWPVRWADVERLVMDATAMPAEERRTHSGTLWWLALAIWRARRDAGENLTFDAAVDSVPVLDRSRFWFVDDAPPPPDPQVPRPARKGSGRGAKRTAGTRD